MNTFRTPLIAVAVLTMVSCAAFAQVRVITPDSEHVYSSDPARPRQLPDDEALRSQNERAERARIARQRELLDRENAQRRAEEDQASKSKWGTYQPPASGWRNPNTYQPPKSGWTDR
jgi:hypothetical protein